MNAGINTRNIDSDGDEFEPLERVFERVAQVEKWIKREPVIAALTAVVIGTFLGAFGFRRTALLATTALGNGKSGRNGVIQLFAGIKDSITYGDKNATDQKK